MNTNHICEHDCRVYIDPRCSVVYASFYIKGLYDCFGRKNVCFSSKYFMDVDMSGYSHDNDLILLFVLEQRGERIRIAVDYRDQRFILPNAYAWCDRYAKINCHDTETVLPEGEEEKLIRIPPSFGIRVWNLPQTVWYAGISLWKVHKMRRITRWNPIAHLKRYLAIYRRRQPIEAYTPDHSERNEPYVFFISTLWSHRNCVEATNVYRKEYMEACRKESGLHFEGGFLIPPPSSSGNSGRVDQTEYEDLRLPHYVSNKEYMRNTKRSLFVFNTPSVWDCHGWKLGEYLAMGKAIVSTPLTNQLPYPLVHGQSIHIVRNKEELEKAVHELFTNDRYRHDLERCAYAYYLEHAAPAVVVKNICH